MVITAGTWYPNHSGIFLRGERWLLYPAWPSTRELGIIELPLRHPCVHGSEALSSLSLLVPGLVWRWKTWNPRAGKLVKTLRRKTWNPKDGNSFKISRFIDLSTWRRKTRNPRAGKLDETSWKKPPIAAVVFWFVVLIGLSGFIQSIPLLMTKGSPEGLHA